MNPNINQLQGRKNQLMRKIIVFNSISLDGYYAGLNGDISWLIHDPEVEQAAHQRMNPDSILFGRSTYQMFEGYWPHVTADSNAPQGAKAMAEELNQMTKIVFSTTLKEVSWINSRLFSGNLAGEIRALKAGTGGDITIFGSGSIVRQLAGEGLIDEYLLSLTPVILGAGQGLFEGNGGKLTLLDQQSFPSGMILLHYGIAEG